MILNPQSYGSLSYSPSNAFKNILRLFIRLFWLETSRQSCQEVRKPRTYSQSNVQCILFTGLYWYYGFFIIYCSHNSSLKKQQRHQKKNAWRRTGRRTAQEFFNSNAGAYVLLLSLLTLLTQGKSAPNFLLKRIVQFFVILIKRSE